jgi:hypothetical protein
MKSIVRAAALVLVVATAILACGCTVSNGVFMGMAQSSTDKSLSASYISFDGSLARSVSLKAGDEVKFSLEGGEGLSAAVMKGGKSVFGITDGGVFTAAEGGTYDFTLSGKAENGSFSLGWQVG